MRQGYVYVLHFEAKLHHARHYVGCTFDLRSRLIAHAQGRSARIVRAFHEQGIPFTVSAIGVTNAKALRRLERQTKDWHNAHEFCTLCMPDLHRAIPGTRPYPLGCLPFPRDSVRLAQLQPHTEVVTVRQTSEQDPSTLVEQVRNLMRQEKDALGFIPAAQHDTTAGLTGSIRAGRVVVTLLDGILAGYAAFTEGSEADPPVKVQQCVVSDQHRRCGFGRRMVEEIGRLRPGKVIQAKVRDDLAANDFWTAIGFRLVRFDTHATSGSRLNVYHREPQDAAYLQHQFGAAPHAPCTVPGCGQCNRGIVRPTTPEAA